jgi:hypothetical protein
MRKIVYTDAEPVKELQIRNIEVVTDEDDEDQIEIYMIDESGARIEGGNFNRDAFLAHVLMFYNDNY